MAPIHRFSVRQVMLPMSYSSFEEDVSVCSALGFGGLAVWLNKLGSGHDREHCRLVQASGLKASVCSLSTNSVLPTRDSSIPHDHKARVRAICADIKRLVPFSPAGVVALTGGAGGRKHEEARAIVLESLRAVAQVANQDGIGLGVEPVRYPEGTSIVSTLAETAQLVEELAADNVGIAFDVWHHWDSPTVLADIAAFGHLITSVHIADWRNPPSGRMDRVLPGQGVIDLARILAALESAGFRGWYELEVFSDGTFEDSILKLDEREMLARGWAGFSRAWAAAGLP